MNDICYAGPQFLKISYDSLQKFTTSVVATTTTNRLMCSHVWVTLWLTARTAAWSRSRYVLESSKNFMDRDLCIALCDDVTRRYNLWDDVIVKLFPVIDDVLSCQPTEWRQSRVTSRLNDTPSNNRSLSWRALMRFTSRRLTTGHRNTIVSEIMLTTRTTQHFCAVA